MIKLQQKYLIIIFFLFITFSDNSFSYDNNSKPKNIIIMISDGCGYNHIQATDFYQYGKSKSQKYESFPIQLFVSTYPAKSGKEGKVDTLQWGSGYNPKLAWTDFNYVNSGYTCSAAAATAIATGIKTKNGVLGVDIYDNPLLNLTERAKEIGKSAGVITTVPFSHATPAGFVAHNKNRDNYKEIARDMLLNSHLDVIMGCGHPYYDDNDNQLRFAKTFKYVGDSLCWTNIINGNTIYNLGNLGTFSVQDCNFDGQPDPWTLIESREDFIKLGQGETPVRVLGVVRAATSTQAARMLNEKNYAQDPMGHKDPYEVPLNKNVPTLSEMSNAAINILNKNKNGFFLMIEGGAIDWAAHNNQSGRMIEEEIDFNKAVESVIDWVEKYSSWDETLLIVTADHETGYLLGPSSGINNQPVWNPIQNNGKGNMPSMEWHSGDHTNSLIPLFAKGNGCNYLDLFADQQDSVRGRFLNNTAIAQTVFILWGKK